MGIAFLVTAPVPGYKPPSAPDLSAVLNGAGWITAALLMALVSVALTRRIAH
jgi:hypothetical protein